MAIKEKITRVVPRELSLAKWYNKKLMQYVKAMSKATEKAILASWKEKKPEMAMDSATGSGTAPQDKRSANHVSHEIERASHRTCEPSDILMDSSPAKTLTEIIRSLRYNWKNEFSQMSDEVSREFTRRAEKSTTMHLKNLLKEVGFGVNYKFTPQLNDILQATIAENVNLIKSIHGVYYDQVQTMVMQGVKNGRDLGYIRKALQDRFSITQRKAAIIARDQTNKATGAIERARTLETGLTKAKWVHIGGKKMDRSTHEAMDGEIFDLREGLYDPAVGRKVMPGELINCNCKYRIVVPDMGQEGGIPLANNLQGKLVPKPKTKAGKELQAKRNSVRNAIFKINDGADEATVPNLRNDLEQYGGTNNVTFVRGRRTKGKKNGFGIEHIIENGREKDIGNILDAVIEGKITRFTENNKRVFIQNDEYEAVLSLVENNNKKTWLLTGYKIDLEKEKRLASDEKTGFVPDKSLRKRGLFHSQRLGADESLKDIVRHWQKKSRIKYENNHR